MAIESFLIILLLAVISGAIGQALVGYNERGIVGATAVGFIGSVLGMVISGIVGLWEFFPIFIGGYRFPILWSLTGAIIVSAVFESVMKRKHHHN